MMTEDEAREKWCPHARYSFGYGDNVANRWKQSEPVDQPHMWHAAVYSTGCKLTALGAHYHNLAKLGRI